MGRSIVGLDIGGANIKAAHADGAAVSHPFAVWQNPERLADALARVLRQLPAFDALAVTMTAELADCFPTKADGVRHVLQKVEQVAGGRSVLVWQTGAEFVDPSVASEIPLLVAAANWHALATFVGRLAPRGGALLIDIGSTTTDVIPLQQGVPVPRGLTDRERLLAGELVYTGVRRTPVCAVVQAVPLDGEMCPVAAEFFATTHDVYLLRGELSEAPDDRDTADGRPATRAAALARLTRMVCCDRTELSAPAVREMADFIARAHEEQIGRAIERVLERLEGRCDKVLLSGQGEFLGRRIVSRSVRLSQADIVRLSECFSPEVAKSACAFALARLAVERADGLV
ncbi:MAG: H4MPT-linked C1 transfer pathway protein [Planctomycetes bacterium]|nr:H4MPT-linked C1 transfer pathway protein [Planctomycetota bacterium]